MAIDPIARRKEREEYLELRAEKVQDFEEQMDLPEFHIKRIRELRYVVLRKLLHISLLDTHARYAEFESAKVEMFRRMKNKEEEWYQGNKLLLEMPIAQVIACYLDHGTFFKSLG